MPQKQQRHSEIWWRGHNDALAGDPPNESYYHYYYDYKLAYDQVRREQRRNRRQRFIAVQSRRLLKIGPVVLLLGLLGYGTWYTYRPNRRLADAAVAAPTFTPRPTPRPTLPPPTPMPPPALHVGGLAVISTDGTPLRVRNKPGTAGAIQTRFRQGQNVRVLEGPQSADGYEWWRIEADGESGWAAGTFLQPVEEPPTPTPTP
jgi:hypothetical protein